ncbi:MAG: DUF2358 domain-containing protein [Coleofasciculus sp. B1-GNL1-01]|uniref:DUF2358 domain-containing protein n=1 Tax=Coleofasciculus sp. B1-GNL1-01 TaxID=3068484 RepID=UPI0032F7AD47
MPISERQTARETDYQAQIQQNIERIKRDLPPLFERDISYDIYTEDICFTDPINTFHGKLSYRIVYWSLRFHAQLFFTKIALDLHDVSQTEIEIAATQTKSACADWFITGVTNPDLWR